MRKSYIKESAYWFLDLINAGKGVSRTINEFVVRFPARWSRYYPNEYEEDNYSFLKQYVKPGMHVIDIGAHIGLFSVCVSQLTGASGKVICFEPTPATFAVLEKVLDLNHCSNVTPLPDAIGAAPGMATFYISDVMEGCNTNSLVLNKDKALTKEYHVKVTSVDAICKEYGLRAGLVKIDAEGAEYDALLGCTETMRTVRPLVILGLHPAFIAQKGDSLQQIWDFIKSNNYRVVFNKSEMIQKDFVSQPELFDVQLIPN